MNEFNSKMEVWFVTGSQHLYGPDTLAQVAIDSTKIAESLKQKFAGIANIIFKPVLTDPEMVTNLCREANATPHCAGLILWMHTFSPAKMWIVGLKQLIKPICHFHTQFNRSLPWATIDMEFMNLNQAAHGDREAGHLHMRLGLKRKVIVGFWDDADVQNEIEKWIRVARGWQALQGTKIARFGDNMRQVSVTEGDKVSAQIQFGCAIDGYGLGDLIPYLQTTSDAEIDCLVKEYLDEYDVSNELLPGQLKHESLRDAARQEIGIEKFLTSNGYSGFTTTFEDLHGLNQLPGLASQRLMNKGFGFGAEGDWKTAMLLRMTKAATEGQKEGTSFMEDYTYDLPSGDEKVLGSHMLEICPSIANSKPKLEIHPLGIGSKSDPVRLVFDACAGMAVNASLIDLGHRFRLVMNTVKAVSIPPLPNLPVARALWKIEPDFKTGAACWIYAGGAHHTVYSYAFNAEQFQDLANIAGIEAVVIDSDTKLRQFQNELRWNEVVHQNRG